MFAGLIPVYNRKLLLAQIEKVLSKIPVKSLTTEDWEVQGEGECCTICIEPYEVSELLKSLPCGHDFHQNCIDPWLLEHHKCPMCKMDIVKYYGQSFTASQERLLQLEMEEVESRALLLAGNPILTSDNSQEEAVSERSSRASPPDELVLSLTRSCDSHRHVSRSSSLPPDSRQETASSSTAQDSAGVSREP